MAGLKTEKGKRSPQGIEPATLHSTFWRRATLLALFFLHSSALVQWLSGGMYAQGPNCLLLRNTFK